MRQPRHPRARGESLRSTSLRMSPTSLGPCCAAEPLLNAFVIFFCVYTDTKHCLAQAQGHIDNGTFMPYAIGAVLRCLTTAPLLPQGKKKSGRNSDDGNFCRKGKGGWRYLSYTPSLLHEKKYPGCLACSRMPWMCHGLRRRACHLLS